MASVGIRVEMIGGKYQGKDGIIYSISSTGRLVRVSLNKSLKSLTGYILIHHIMILENIGPSGEVANTSSATLVNQSKTISPKTSVKNHQSKNVTILEPDIDTICNVIGSSKDKPRGASSWKTFWEISTKENWPEQCTEVRFASFLSGGFTTMAVINPPERNLAKCTSVQCKKNLCLHKFNRITLWHVSF